jgi:very-short-patch-repair endonuclease
MHRSSQEDRSITRAESGQSTDHLDGLLAGLALAQGGAVGRAQLAAHGIGEDVIDWRLSSGHLHVLMLAGRPLKGVYAVGRARLERRVGWQWAAWLACGSESVISHRSGADVQDMLTSGRLEVTIAPEARRRRAGITVYRRALDPQDITTVNGLRATAWPRTVLDLAAVESSKRLALALDRTVTLGLFDLNAIDDLLERHPRAHGAPRLRAAVAQMTDEGERTASPAEVDVLWLVLSSDLPRPLVNAPVLGYVADLLWPAQRLIVEVDSKRWHDGPFARRDDHRRQAALEAAGYAVIRVRASDPPHQILQRIRHALAARSVDNPV